MKKLLSLATLTMVALASLLTGSAQAQYADLKLTFVYKGKAPEPKPVTAGADPFCAALKIESDALLVNPKNNGIADVIVFPDAKSFDAKKADPGAKVAAEKPELDNKNCQFIPHVVVLKTGQTLTVKNSDKTGHNANFAFFNNDGQNQQIPAGGKADFKVTKAEPGAIPVTCGSHSWMKAYVVVQDHPFVGVSNADGVLEIKGLPPGKIALKITHEVGKFKELTIGGKAYPVKRGSFEIELKPGANDLGTVELGSDTLSP